MGTTTRKSGKVYIANESFIAQDANGIDQAYHADRSRVYEGDPILERCPNYFDLLEDHDGE